MLNISRETPITFYGHCSDFIEQSMYEFTHIHWTGSITGYYGSLSQRLNSVMVVPLLSNEFNRCKSNIAWIEGTFAGAAVLAPAFEEFAKVDGIMTYDTQEVFELNALEMIKNTDFCKQMWQKSKDYINANLLLSKINPLRLEIFENVINL